jgi:glycerol-3-phosphate O-acyltransferase
VIKDLAGPNEEQRRALEDKARSMLDELAATPDPPTLRGLEIAADTLVDRVYAGVDVDEEGIERVREAAKKGSLVFLPSHKSHVDYMLLSFVLRKNALQIPAIAAGDNLAFFPVGPLFRNAGAFFIRRSFKGDRLYMAVVDAYVRRLIRDGFAIEFFLEGGRSRQGKLLAPKLGLLNMVVDAALGVEHRAVSFVPVSIGYERTIEAGSYARELSGGAKKKEDAAALLKLGDVLRDKYGRANVQFGQVLDLDELCKQQGTTRGAMPPPKRRALVTRLAHRVMGEINRVTAVTAGSLVATALLCHGRRGLPHVELVEHVARLVKLVIRLGARTAPGLTRGGELREGAVRDAAILYVRGGLVRQHVPGDTLTGTAKRRARIYTGDDVIYTVPDEQRIVLDIPKNIIVHLFVDRALVALALLAPPGPPLARSELGKRVQSLSRLFKHEFMFRADASFETIFAETLADMTRSGELAIVDASAGELVGFGPGHDGLDGRGWIAFYASVVKSFVESYRVAARAVRVLEKTPLAEKDLAARALRIGEQMFLGGEIERAEAVSQPVFENAFLAFVDQGYLTRSSGKLILAPSFAGETEAAAIEGTIAAYLRRRSGESAF